MNNHLFAYGFLKRAYHGSVETNTPLMDVEFVAEGLYQGRMYRVSSYPGVIFDKSSDFRVKGEIFRLKDPELILPILDRYEHSLPLITTDPDYHRRLRPVKTKNGIIECWVYEYIHPIGEDKLIGSGEF